jgi:hypothetical protein
MPLVFALPLGLLAGGSLAWLARSELARSDVPLLLARPFLVALAFALVVVLPILGWFVTLHGDWAYLYLVDASRVPSAVDLVLATFAALQVPLGFAIAAPLAVARRATRLLTIGAALAGLVALACALASRRLGTSATHAQWVSSFGLVPIGQSPLGRGVLTSWVALTAALGWAALAVRSGRTSRRDGA